MAITVIFFDLGETLVTSPPKRDWLTGAQPLLRDLRQSGFRLGIISNTADLLPRAKILKLLPADFDPEAFEANLILFSSEIKMAKPDLAIFREAIARSTRPASECLFCSESILDTLMAQQAGMRSIRVQTAPNSDLSKLKQEILDFQQRI